VADETAETAVLLLSELMTNALRHARTSPGREIGVRIAMYDRRLRVEVADAGDGQPRLRAAGAEDESGRGFALVVALADRHGVCPRLNGIGKAVWAEIRLGAVAAGR
jgi:anti-sigma regulatory factor (Ser/Thr protein kinase)